jgi:HTH-type transcriptional regulator/antitoxin HigA
MEIKPILTEQDHTDALQAIDEIFDAGPGTPEGDRLEVLATLVEAYEARHYSIPLPDPIAAIEYHMQRLGLTRKDLQPLIGSRARVSEVLNRKRPLTIRMIRNLSAELGISAQALLQEYPLVEPKATHYPTQRTPTHQIAERKLDQGE